MQHLLFLLVVFLINNIKTSQTLNAAILKQKVSAALQPENIHIALGDTSQDIVVMWASGRGEDYFVEYAEDVNNMQRVNSEMAVLEESSKRCLKYLYRARLSNLRPGVKYLYRIVGKSGFNSNPFAFTVPKTRKGIVHTFMVLADMGLSSKSLPMLAYEAATGIYEAVFHLGDIAYDLHHDEGNIGDLFQKKVAQFSSTIPYMTVPGDHERFLNFAHYRYRFSMPNTRWPMPPDQLWYSLGVGPIYFITLNTEVFYSVPDQLDKHMTWLRDEFWKVNRNREQHPWLIVLGHKPLYSSAVDGDEEDTERDCSSEATCNIRSKLEDFFYEQGVDLYICGHRHNYERTWPTYRMKSFQQNYKNPKAPIYITIGAMGHEYVTDSIVKQAVWSAFSTSDSQKELYGKLEVLNATHLMWDVYAASNNEKVDSVLIVQWSHGTFGKPGEDAYEKMMHLKHLPPAPLGWHPQSKPQESQGWVYDALFSLPPSVRKVYLGTVCLTLLTIICCLLAMPCFRKRICRKYSLLV